jgi:phage FluMu gp28-like protein
MTSESLTIDFCSEIVIVVSDLQANCRQQWSIVALQRSIVTLQWCGVGLQWPLQYNNAALQLTFGV